MNTCQRVQLASCLRIYTIGKKELMQNGACRNTLLALTWQIGATMAHATQIAFGDDHRRQTSASKDAVVTLWALEERYSASRDEGFSCCQRYASSEAAVREKWARFETYGGP